MADNAPKRRDLTTVLGLGLFFLFVMWGLWHGVIGPRVIKPVPLDDNGRPITEAPAPASGL